VAAGAFLGLIIGFLLAFVLEALDDTLKTPDDVEQHVGLTVVGAIPASSPNSDRRTPARKQS
jgi:capsular polysaccharide biosynthesis protein